VVASLLGKINEKAKASPEITETVNIL